MNTRPTTTLIGAMMLLGLGAATYAGCASHAGHSYVAVAVLALAAATSRMKVKLPGINGNMSVNLPFLLTAVVNLSAVEAIVITCISTTLQCWPRKNAKFNPQQMAFNLSMVAFATSSASLTFHRVVESPHLWHSSPGGLALATVTLFLGQTLPVAAIVTVSEAKPAGRVWLSLAQLSFPYYVVSAGVTSMVQAMTSHLGLGWGLALQVFPVMYVIHRCYRLYFSAVEETLSTEVPIRAAGAGA